MGATDPIRNKKQLYKLADYFLEKNQLRNYVLVVFGSYTALRISDLLSLTWDDVYDPGRKQFRKNIEMNEKKTGKHKIIALNKRVIQALRKYFPKRSGKYIFSNGRTGNKPISRVHAWRIITEAAKEVGIDGRISCHSLRKTFGYHAWKYLHTPLALLVVMFNNSSVEVTKRYLGIEQDDINEVYLKIKLC